MSARPNVLCAVRHWLGWAAASGRRRTQSGSGTSLRQEVDCCMHVHSRRCPAHSRSFARGLVLNGNRVGKSFSTLIVGAIAGDPDEGSALALIRLLNPIARRETKSGGGASAPPPLADDFFSVVTAASVHGPAWPARQLAMRLLRRERTRRGPRARSCRRQGRRCRVRRRRRGGVGPPAGGSGRACGRQGAVRLKRCCGGAAWWCLPFEVLVGGWGPATA